MSSVTRPRGPLPARVYWTRRMLVLGVMLALFVGAARVLGSGSNATEQPRAETVAGTPAGDAQPSMSPPMPAGESSGTTKPPRKAPTKADAKARNSGKKLRKPKAALPTPSGPCEDSDVIVTAQTDTARAGGTVPITLLFTTRTSEACTFAVSAETVVVKLTSGADRIWSSQQCPRAVPETTVIARRTVPGTAVVSWHGHRSNEECSKTAPWALPGYYHAQSAVLGAEPTDVQFQLHSPERATITPKPKVKKKRRG